MLHQSSLGESFLPLLLTTLLGDIEQPPFFCKIEFCPESDHPPHAVPLDLSVLHAFTLQEAQEQKSVHTIEKEVEALSVEGGVQFRAFIRPGYGFTKWGGLYAPGYLKDCLVIFIAGFNDLKNWDVFRAIDDHVEKYLAQGASLAFVEVNDHHGSNLWWISHHFQKIARRDPDNVCYIRSTTLNALKDLRESADALPMFAYPDEGWTAEHYQYDTYHLSKSGLLQWLPSIGDFATQLAARRERAKVLFVTDSTFAGHDFQAAKENEAGDIYVVAQTLSGAIRFRLRESDTILHLKKLIANAKGLLVQNICLMRSLRRNELKDERTFASYRVRDGATLLVLPRNPAYGSSSSSGSSEHVAQEAYYIPQSLLASSWIQHNNPREFEIALNIHGVYDGGNDKWLTSAQWEDSFHGTGLCHGLTMSEMGFRLSRGVNGIYSTPDLDLAFSYATRFEHLGRWYEVVVRSRVNTSRSQSLAASGEVANKFWIVQSKEDVRPHSLVVRELMPSASQDCSVSASHTYYSVYTSASSVSSGVRCLCAQAMGTPFTSSTEIEAADGSNGSSICRPLKRLCIVSPKPNLAAESSPGLLQQQDNEGNSKLLAELTAQRRVAVDLTAENDDLRRLLEIKEAETEALRQQIEVQQGAHLHDVLKEEIEELVVKLQNLPGRLINTVLCIERKSLSRLFSQRRHDASVLMLFELFNYSGNGILDYDMASDLAQALGWEDLDANEFNRLCHLAGDGAERGLRLLDLQALYKMSSRRPSRDLLKVLGRNRQWLRTWGQFVEFVLQTIDDAAGGRDATYTGTLAITSAISDNSYLQLPDEAPLFPGSQGELHPERILSKVREIVETLQGRFYQWGCWMREHYKSVHANIHNEDTCLVCVGCGAAPWAFVKESEGFGRLLCRGCSNTRRCSCRLEVTGVPDEIAQPISYLYAQFADITQSLGLAISNEVTDHCSFWEAFTIPLGRLRNPPLLPSTRCPVKLVPRSLLARLSKRAQEVSAARARARCGLSLRHGSGFETITITRNDFSDGHLEALKLSLGISDETHLQYGPKDANMAFVCGQDQWQDVAWPLTYWYIIRPSEEALQTYSCHICSAVMYNEHELGQHVSSHRRHLFGEWG